MRNKKGFTLAEMLVVIAIIGILVGIVASVISVKLETAREATDLANIRNCIAMVQNAYLNDSGTNPSEYNKSGPYASAYDNEKDLGTREVVRVYSKTNTIYKMFVMSQQKIDGWQGSTSSVAGKEIPAKTSAKMYRILMQTSKPDEIEITVSGFGGKLK